MKYSFERKLNSDSSDMMRVHRIIEDTRDNGSEAFCLGVTIAAPLVYQYVEWVLESAVNKGVELLLFVMRDGYILKKVADIIIRRRGYDIRTKYIFGSRVAWRYPELTLEKLQELNVWEQSNWIFRDPAYAYVPLRRLNFSMQEIKCLFGEDLCRVELNTYAEFKKVLDGCIKNVEFRNMLVDKISDAGELVVKYIEQEVPVDVKFAFVDTNSTGKTQADLEKILSKRRSRVSSLYFFYHTYMGKTIDLVKQCAYNVTSDTSARIPEALLRAPYNQCYGYQTDENGRVLPVFCDVGVNSWNNRFDYDAYLQGIVNFSKNIEKNKCHSFVNIKEYADFILDVVNLKRVSLDVTEKIGAMPFNPNLDGQEVKDFYPQLRLSAVFHPFSELIYYPKASFYLAGCGGRVLYQVLYKMVELRRFIGHYR